MKIKVQCDIIENNQTNFSTNFNHQIYSAILNNLSIELSKQIHKKLRFKRFFTFTTLYINNNKCHFYISGEDKIIKDFINNIIKNQIITIDKIIMNATSIDSLEEIKEKESYKFKTDFIINQKENNKVCLSKDFDYIKKRISDIAKDKYKEIYKKEINDDIKIEFLKCKKVYTTYKNFHLNSYKCLLKLKGNYELIKLINNVGIGENTASGHGFCWEVL